MNRKLFLAAAALGLATSTITSAQAQTADLSTLGVAAPTANVGTDTLSKGTLQYNNSLGAADAFSVGTNTSISASASASSTSDYGVTSTANFGLGFQQDANSAVTPSTINQFIGSSGAQQSTISQIEQAATLAAQSAVSQELESKTKTDTDSSGNTRYWWWRNNTWNNSTTRTEYDNTRSEIQTNTYESAYNSAYSALTQSSALSGTITGSFEKTYDSASGAASNQVTVRGIGANNTITAADDASFSSTIQKNLVVTNQAAIDLDATVTPIYGSGDSAGTASGSASGNVSTTASANANSTEFVSSFAQAY